MNNSTSNYYIGLMEQCEIEQDIFESMLAYDYKLASLGSINESTISDIDAQYLTEASENIFKKMCDGVIFVLRKIKEFFINIGKWVKGLFDKDKKKNKIIEQQVKEAENAAKQDKVIIDVEVAKDNLLDKSEKEILSIEKQVMEDTNTQAFHKHAKGLQDNLDQINAMKNKIVEKQKDYDDREKRVIDLLKSLNETTYTADNGQKRKGVVVNKEVSKKIAPNKNQYDSPIGPADFTVKIRPVRYAEDIPSRICSGLNDDLKLAIKYMNNGNATDIHSLVPDRSEIPDKAEYTTNEMALLWIATAFDKNVKTKEDLNNAIKSCVYGKEEVIQVRKCMGVIEEIQKLIDRYTSKKSDILERVNAIDKFDKEDLMVNKHFTTDELSILSKIVTGANIYLNKVYLPVLNEIQHGLSSIQNEMQKATHNIIIQPASKQDNNDAA